MPRAPPCHLVEVRTRGLGALGLDDLAVRPVLAGQKSLRQRAVGKHIEVPGFGDGQQRALEVPFDEVVVRLKESELGKRVFALDLEGGGEPLRRVVGGAEVAHRARSG